MPTATAGSRPVYLNNTDDRRDQKKSVDRTTHMVGAPETNPGQPRKLTDRMKKMLATSVLDDFSTRSRMSKGVRETAAKKQQLARMLSILGMISLLVMLIAVHMRLVVLWEPEPATLVSINVMKSINIVVTLAMEVLIVRFHALNHKLIAQCSGEIGAFDWAWPIFEGACMLVGITLPGVEYTFPAPRLDHSPLAIESCPPTKTNCTMMWHFDQLGILQLGFRVPFIFMWWVSFNVIASPVYIAWQYNVHASPTFRIKYLFTRRPLQMVGIIFVSVWACGALTLHALEFPHEESLIVWVFATFDVMSGLGWSGPLPATYIGRVTGVLISLFGILCIAVLTAALCSSSELDATEAWLIGQIEHRAHSQRRMQIATTMVQKAFRMHLRFGGSTAPAGREAEWRRARRAVVRDVMRFRAARINAERDARDESRFMNVKTLHGEIRGLLHGLQQVSERLDRVESGAPALVPTARQSSGASSGGGGGASRGGMVGASRQASSATSDAGFNGASAVSAAAPPQDAADVDTGLGAK